MPTSGPGPRQNRELCRGPTEDRTPLNRPMALLQRLLILTTELPRQLLLLLVRAYRLLLKPSLGNACRFEPSCSQYALDALGRHGAAAGSALTAGRLLRCHPWCDGGLDPVPRHLPGLFGRLGLGAAPYPDEPGPAPARPDTREPAP